MVDIIRRLCIVLICFAGLYGIILGVLWAFEDSFLYHPRSRKNDKAVVLEKMPKLKEVEYFLPNGSRLYGWYRAPKKGNKIILHFHGNSYNTEKNMIRVRDLYVSDYGLFFPEYRGYGDIKGKISQQSMQEDVATAYKYLKGRGYVNKDIIVYGHSMGTYNTVYTAATFGQDEPFHAVILEAPFLSAAQTASEVFMGLFPVKSLMKNHYPSETLIGKIKSPIFIGHGKKDKLIKFHQGWEMYNKANNPKSFFVSEQAAHDDLPENGFIKAALDWLKTGMAQSKPNKR